MNMYRVFLVDNEPYILEGLRNIIDWNEYGLEIAGEALNGLDALKQLDFKEIDILLTDIKMPKMDGLQLMRTLKQSKPNIKFIVLSWYDEFNYIKQGIKYGIENYLLKPINVNELASTLVNTVEKIERENSNDGIIRLKKGLDILRNNILYRWITNSINLEELKERSKVLNINLECYGYTVSIIKVIYPPDNVNKVDYNKLSKTIAKVYDLCNETVNPPDSEICFIDLDGSIVLIFCDPANNLSRFAILEKLKNICANIRSKLNLDLFITLGDCQQGYSEIYKSYINAKKLHEYQPAFGDSEIIDYAKVTQGQTANPILPCMDMTSPVIKEVLNYVNRHYSDELSLKTLGQTFNINSTYLGQLFQKEVGVYFCDYINKFKLDKAKQLLLNTNLKTFQIAQKVGFTSPTYFFRQFKKYFGVTPVELRNCRVQAPQDSGPSP